jgi:hypothetical protein
MRWLGLFLYACTYSDTATEVSLCLSPTPVTCLRKIVGIPGKGAYLQVTQIKIKLCPYCTVTDCAFHSSYQNLPILKSLSLTLIRRHTAAILTMKKCIQRVRNPPVNLKTHTKSCLQVNFETLSL